MFKESTYKEKFQVLSLWLPVIVREIKKDLKNQHLKSDLGFLKKYLPGKTINKINNEELASAYSKALSEEMDDELGEFIANRWLLQNSDVYYHFEEKFRQLNPDFEKIEELDKNHSRQMIEEAAREFGPTKTYIFSVLNSVVFPKEFFEELAQKASQEKELQEKIKEESTEKKSLEDLKREHEREIARMTNHYEKKILGLQKKYQIDVETLKKQVSQLQRKLNG